MFIAEAPPENQAPSGAACRIGEQTNGSMPLLTELAEIVVGCGSYKHAAPTDSSLPAKSPPRQIV